MDFKYFYIAILAVSCQQINETEPAAVDLDKINAPPVITPPTTPFDTVYKAAACNTGVDLIVDGSVSFSIAKWSEVTASSTCTAYRFEDQYNQSYIMVYMHNQDLIPKCFKIIPYDPKLNIKNYDEAMILIHYGWSGGMDLAALSGTFSHNSLLKMGFCNVPFEEQSQHWKYTASFSF